MNIKHNILFCLAILFIFSCSAAAEDLPLVYSYEAGFVNADINNLVEVNAKDLSVTEVIFSVNSNVSNVQLNFNKLDDKPLQVTKEVPLNFIYQYFQIVSIIDTNKLSFISVKFEVPVLWLNQSNINENSVFFARWNTTDWEVYSTGIISKTEDKIIYSTNISKFSIFAIGAQLSENLTEVITINNSILQTAKQQNITCFDGLCNSAGGENCSVCPQDCGVCPAVCGDNFCDKDKSEDETTCPGDCKADYSSFLIIGVIAGIIIIVILFALFFLKNRDNIVYHEKPPAEKEYIPGEEELVSYINKMHSAGYSDIQIKDYLTKAGWRTDIIEQALKKYSKK